MRFIRVTTRVITAQSIITKENKSLYVTIGTSPFLIVRQLVYHTPSAPWVSILYCQGSCYLLCVITSNTDNIWWDKVKAFLYSLLVVFVGFVISGIIIHGLEKSLSVTLIYKDSIFFF